MEAGRCSYWNSTHLSTEPPNRSNIYGDLSRRGSFYSDNLRGGSTLPPIEGGDFISRRSVRYTRPEKTERIIKPSKHGFHRHGNTPTYKLLKEVCEKLQLLVERQLSQAVPDDDDQNVSKDCENGEDFNGFKTKETHGTNSSGGDSGIKLDLTDFSGNVSASDSVFLTPLPEDQLECVYNIQPQTQIHLYFPKVSDIPEADDTSPVRSVPSTAKGDNTDENSHHRDFTYFHDSFMNRHGQHMKNSSTKLPKIKSKGSCLKPRIKKVQLSRSKRSEKSSLVSKCITKSGVKCEVDNKNETPPNVDFLNDITTLISEERKSSCTFSDLSSTAQSDSGFNSKNDNRDCNKSSEKENSISDINNKQISQTNPSSWCFKTTNDFNKDRFVNCSTCSVIHGCADNLNFSGHFKHGLNLGENINLITMAQ